MSSASAASQAWFSRPRARSTSSAEPTFTTMRRNWPSSASVAVMHGSLQRGSRRCFGLRASRGRRSTASSARSASGTPWPEARGQHQRRRASARALEAGDLLLQGFGIERVGLRQRDDLGLLVEAVAIGLELARARACRPCRHARSSPSTRCSSTRQRSTWPRKRSPRPAPSCAPSIRPGMSASTNSRPSARTTPRPGCSVVNG